MEIYGIIFNFTVSERAAGGCAVAAVLHHDSHSSVTGAVQVRNGETTDDGTAARTAENLFVPVIEITILIIVDPDSPIPGKCITAVIGS